MDFFKGKNFNLTVNFPKLTRIRQRLGIDSQQIKLAQFVSTGSISLDNQEDFDQLVHISQESELNKIILIGGQVSVLYIKDNSNRQSSDIEDLTKVHLTECTTIRNMKKHKRFHRYIGVMEVRDDKKFDITLSHHQQRAKLYVCQHCLNQLGMSKNHKNITDFDYKNHIKRYTQKIKEYLSHYDYNAPSYLYPYNWSQISAQNKRENKYICHGCGVDLSQNKRLLDVHHKDSDKSNINHSNLECLCKSCHSEIHPFYKNLVAKEINLINQIKRQQGLI